MMALRMPPRRTGTTRNGGRDEPACPGPLLGRAEDVREATAEAEEAGAAEAAAAAAAADDEGVISPPRSVR